MRFEVRSPLYDFVLIVAGQQQQLVRVRYTIIKWPWKCSIAVCHQILGQSEDSIKKAPNSNFWPEKNYTCITFLSQNCHIPHQLFAITKSSQIHDFVFKRQSHILFTNICPSHFHHKITLLWYKNIFSFVIFFLIWHSNHKIIT